MEEAKKMKCYRRVIYEQLIYPSLSSLWTTVSELFEETFHAPLYEDAILMYRFGARIWPPEINRNTWSSLFLQKLFLFTRELAYVHINISSNTWNGYNAENQEEKLLFNETAFLFSCHALWKLGSSNCFIFEMKHASGLKTCTKIYFLIIFNLV